MEKMSARPEIPAAVRSTNAQAAGHEISKATGYPRRISLAISGLVVLLALVAGTASVWLAGLNLWPRVHLDSHCGNLRVQLRALAIGRIPGLALDRAGIALVGAAMMVAARALPLDEAYKAIDLDTLTLLLGMMIVVAYLRLSGFLSLATSFATRKARHSLSLLIAITALAGILSAFLVNDAICLVLTPLVIGAARSSRRHTLPYLLVVAMASNIGSTATITGNPQNMMIGSFSQIPYTNFARTLAPVALAGPVLTVALIVMFHRRDITNRARAEDASPEILRRSSHGMEGNRRDSDPARTSIRGSAPREGGDHYRGTFASEPAGREPAASEPAGREPARLCGDRLSRRS